MGGGVQPTAGLAGDFILSISHAGDSKLACACVEGPGAPGNGANKSGANHPVPRRAPCLQPVMNDRLAYINRSIVTCQGSSRSELP